MSDCSSYDDASEFYCGSDGVSYPNLCEISNAECKSDGEIRAVHQGRCLVERTPFHFENVHGSDPFKTETIHESNPYNPFIRESNPVKTEVVHHHEPDQMKVNHPKEEFELLIANEILSNQILPGDHRAGQMWELATDDDVDDLGEDEEYKSNKIDDEDANDISIEQDMNSDAPVFVQTPSQKRLPLNENGALMEDWDLVQDDCAQKNSESPFVGRRFAFKNDKTLIAIYDKSGVLAGVQFSYKYKGRKKEEVGADKPRLLYKGDVYVTVYFIEVDDICKDDDTYRRKIVRKLTLLLGMGKYQHVPWVRSQLHGRNGGSWIQGKCTDGLGDHYWKEMNHCREMFPISLLYTRNGLLNGVGFNTLKNVYSPWVESTKRAHLGLYMNNVPRCLMRHQHKSFVHMQVVFDASMENVSCNW